MTANEFVTIAGRLRKQYPKVGFFGDPELLEIWFLYLCKFDADAVKAAIDEWISKNKKPPTPDDIQYAAGKYQEGRESWNEAMEQRRIKAAKSREEADEWLF